MQIGKTIEIYKGYSILESFGEHRDAGFPYQIDIRPGDRFRYMGVMSVEKARREIDWLSEI